MEGGRDESAWRRALEMGDIVGNILHRTGSSLSMIRCKGVCPAWRDAATAPGFIDEFCKKTEQANVGYIVQFGEGQDKRTSLLYNLTSEGHETADYMRGKVGVEALRQEDVLSSANVFVHVNVYNGVGWDTTDLGPIVSDGEALFHHNPYCVLDGNYLYMMYLVKYIICFELDSKGFSGILLPGELGQTVTSCNQYTVAPRTGGGLVLVQFGDGTVDKWVMTYTDQGQEWSQEKRVNLFAAFDDKLNTCCWTKVLFRLRYPVAVSNKYTVRIKCASKDGRFVLISLGFEEGLFELDMVTEAVREINNATTDGIISKIFHVGEKWPPA